MIDLRPETIPRFKRRFRFPTGRAARNGDSKPVVFQGASFFALAWLRWALRAAEECPADVGRRITMTTARIMIP